MLIWMSILYSVITGRWLCDVSTVWLTALSAAELFVSPPLKGQPHSNPHNKKQNQIAIIFAKQTVYHQRFRDPLWPLLTSSARCCSSCYHSYQRPCLFVECSKQVVLSVPLRSQSFVGPVCLHLFWNVRQPLNSESAHSEPLTNWTQRMAHWKRNQLTDKNFVVVEDSCWFEAQFVFTMFAAFVTT